MLITKYLIVFLLTAIGALAQTITHNTVSRGLVNLGVGDTVISPGAYWSIINNAATVLAGGLNVGAGSGFYVSSNNNLIALSVTLLNLGTITNNGIIAFNSIQSTTAQTYNFVGLQFTNNGEMYLGGDGGYGVPVMSITTPTWTNNGLMVFYQKTRSTGATLLGAPAGSITNTGTICFTNQFFQQTTSINGNGCLVARDGGNIYIQKLIITCRYCTNNLFGDRDFIS
jgi:Hyphally regulated cell wall protein N-terminal.